MKEKIDELRHPEYWDSYYANADGTQPTHEWFQSFAALNTFFDRHLFEKDKQSRIIHLGAGDSTIPNDLAKLGYHNQICIDFSTTVVKIMSAKASEGISWLHGDVRNLVEVPDNSIDVAFDKGTLDAMIYGSPWDPPDEVKENTALYMNEVYRVLKKDGVFLYITFRQPHFIKPVVNANNLWQLETEVLGDDDAGFDYYAYVMVKRMTG